MRKYLLSYDLYNAESSDYADVDTEIEKLGHVEHCGGSTWLIDTNKTEYEMKKLVDNIFDDDDSCILVRIQGNPIINRY